MSRFWNPLVKTLHPYVPGEQPKLVQPIKLNTNENPYPPSPNVDAVFKSFDTELLKLYPDPNADQLKQTLANEYQLTTDQIFVGNGSDEVLAHVFLGLLKHDLPVLFPDVTYSFYPVYCGLYEIDFKTISLDQTFTLNVQDYQQPNGGIIFPNPNAPTGRALNLQQIQQLLELNRDSVVVIDEAYVDFGAESAVSLINQFDNLLVVHTFSKSRSLAGLRVGYAMGHRELIDGLDRVKNSFNSYPLGRVAQLAAIAAVEDRGYFQQCCQQIIADREYLVMALTQLGFELIPSKANFVFAKHPKYDAADIQQQLRQHEVIVRHFKHARIDQYLRITIGTNQECKRLIELLTTIIQ